MLNKIRISARGRHTLYGRNSDQEDETAFIVEFTIPFGLPVGREKSVGMLEGYVRDQETGQSIPNAILRLNGAPAVTDSDGKFTFPALKLGTFYLDIDSASIGLERIPVQKPPARPYSFSLFFELMPRLTSGCLMGFYIFMENIIDFRLPPLALGLEMLKHIRT